MKKDPNFNRHAGIESLPGDPLNPNQRRPVRVDEDGIEIYAGDELKRISKLDQEDFSELAQAGIIGWDEAARMVDEQRSNFPSKVKVDPSCQTIPAAYDPIVRRTALEALNKSVNDKAAGKAEYGFLTSQNMWRDGYSVGPIFSSGRQRIIDSELVSRMAPGLMRSMLNGTYRPSLLVHAHPNNRPPSPPGHKDQTSSNNLGIPIASIDREGNLFCVLPRSK